MPKRTWMDELAKHFPIMIVVLLALFAFTLTNCVPTEETPQTESSKKRTFAGTWVRAADYCVYVKHMRESCADLDMPPEDSSPLVYESDWRTLLINEHGVVMSYANEKKLAKIEITTHEKSLLKPYSNYEYDPNVKTDGKSQADSTVPTFIYLDNNFLNIWVVDVQTQTKIPYLRVSDADAYTYENKSTETKTP